MSHAELSETHNVERAQPVGTPHDEEKGTAAPYERKSPYAEEKKLRRSSSLSHSENAVDQTAVLNAKEEADIETSKQRRHDIYRRIRPFFLTAIALVILGWWISATVLPATRHRWYLDSSFSDDRQNLMNSIF
jgi:CNT family concentrative nucleoside transporter